MRGGMDRRSALIEQMKAFLPLLRSSISTKPHCSAILCGLQTRTFPLFDKLFVTEPEFQVYNNNDNEDDIFNSTPVVGLKC